MGLNDGKLPSQTSHTDLTTQSASQMNEVSTTCFSYNLWFKFLSLFVSWSTISGSDPAAVWSTNIREGSGQGRGWGRKVKERDWEQREDSCGWVDEGRAHITGQFLIVLHQLLILLVDRQHLADPVGCRLRLHGEDERGERERQNETLCTHSRLHRFYIGLNFFLFGLFGVVQTRNYLNSCVFITRTQILQLKNMIVNTQTVLNYDKKCFKAASI